MHTHTHTHLPRQSSGRVFGEAIGIGGGIVDEGVGAAGRIITHYIRLVQTHNHILLLCWLSGRVSGMAIGKGGDKASEGVGAAGRRINGGVCTCKFV